MAVNKDSNAAVSSKKAEKSIDTLLLTAVYLVIASAGLGIVISIVELALGNPAYGVSAVALSSLFGAVIVAILNGSYFEPRRAEEEREHQRERDREEREEQKAQLRKALYNEMVIGYCIISTSVDWLKALGPALSHMQMPSDIVKSLADFPLYESTLQTTPLLFWQLSEAQTIATFYRILKDALREAALPESGTMPSYKKIAEVLEGALLRSAAKMVVDANIDIALLRECGDVMWKPCIDKLEKGFEDPKKLAEDSRKFDEARLIGMLKGAG